MSCARNPQPVYREQVTKVPLTAEEYTQTDDDEDGEPRNWGDHGNLDLHGWAFDRFTTLLDYKAKADGIDVEFVSECDT